MHEVRLPFSEIVGHLKKKCIHHEFSNGFPLFDNCEVRLVYEHVKDLFFENYVESKSKLRSEIGRILNDSELSVSDRLENLQELFDSICQEKHQQ